MANLDKLTFVLDAKMTGLEQTLSRADRQIRSFADNADKSNQLAASSFNLLKNAALGFLTVSSAKEIIGIADSYQLLQSRIRTATDSMQSFNYASAELFSISQNTATALETNVALFQRLKIGATELGRTDSDVLRLVEAINKLGVIGGASQTEISNASIQLSQALAGGIVRAEEFNSIVENTPLLAQAIAEGLNVSVGELRQMVLDGRLLADDVFESILGQTGKINAKFDELGSNLGRSIQRATGAMEQFIGKLDDASGFTQTIAKWLDEWAKSVQIVTAQMSRSEIYDQAEAVNEAESKYKKLNAEIQNTRNLAASMPGNEILKSQLADEERRLDLIKAQLETERKRLELLTSQDILTPGAGKRLGIDIPAESGPAKTPTPLIEKVAVASAASSAAAASASKSSAAPANKKRGLLEGFQDFAPDQNASAFFGLAGDLENYRESQMSALDIETGCTKSG
ncbi:MAG: tape measure protein [Hahellaceae bacterium]|nr:tape measure protein [Hahellaceae bacterium]